MTRIELPHLFVGETQRKALENTDWVPISWEEAIGEIGERLKKIIADDPRKISFLTMDHHIMPILTAYMAAVGTP